MIFIGIGANLPSDRFGAPLAACEAALQALTDHGLRVVGRSNWYESAPVPMSDQPWYVNGVVEIETPLDAPHVLAELHAIEAAFGRVRTVRNAPRVIDLDLVAYDDVVLDGQLMVPHPRMAERAFVVLPLAELAPQWVHPVTGEAIAEIKARLPKDQEIRRVR